MVKKFIAFLSIFISIQFCNCAKYVSPKNSNMAEKITTKYQDSVKCPEGCTDCYIRPLYTPEETGLTKPTYSSATLAKYLNKPMEGWFTFHAYPANQKFTYGGECGLGVRYAFHAGVGGYMFQNTTKASKDVWVRSKLQDTPNHYIRNDNVCVNKCVKIEYHEKTLTIPIMDVTNFFPYNHLDLSEAAFKWLKRGTDPNERVKPTITFMECPP